MEPKDLVPTKSTAAELREQATELRKSLSRMKEMKEKTSTSFSRFAGGPGSAPKEEGENLAEASAEYRKKASDIMVSLKAARAQAEAAQASLSRQKKNAAEQQVPPSPSSVS